MRLNRQLCCVLGLVATTVGLLFAEQAQAVIVTNTFRNVAPSGGSPGQAYDPATEGGTDNFSASSVDLLQGLSAVYTGSTTAGALTNDYPSPMGEVSTGVSAWTDGAIIGRYAGDADGDGNTSNDIDDFAIIHDGYGTISTGGSVTYDLGSVYELSQVDIFFGWNDSGRDDTSFTLRSSVDGETYTTITSVSKMENQGGGDPVTNLYNIVDDASGAIAPFARYLQLSSIDADNGYAGLLEIDAFGTAPQFDQADANRDGVVDIDDFYTISDHFLQVPSALGLDGDIVADNFVDATDFRYWKQHVPASLLAQIEGVAVPEPASLTGLGILVVLGYGLRLRRRA
ncbi:discoidin domain-containing protein [Aeoliella mucimassa]|uniref:Uncharacterized protein n=1 Tax=Aeoliella mucimassa TaxID=2527972 RepID=A0A518AMF0_9BACT|nr:discoidin domain-containing protein [Aeoliella mucimassa]QDU55902.1 hypothetical protein Pan181_21040 [Aeoliella mucimassa]